MIFRFSAPYRALGAIFRNFWAKMAGYETLVDEETRQKRVNTCDSCAYLTEERQCRECSCFVDYKALLATESCPKGYWKAVWQKKVRQNGSKNDTV